MDTTFFVWFFSKMKSIWDILEGCSVFGFPLGTILIGFVSLSIIITVFWRGAQG